MPRERVVGGIIVITGGGGCRENNGWTKVLGRKGEDKRGLRYHVDNLDLNVMNGMESSRIFIILAARRSRRRREEEEEEKRRCLPCREESKHEKKRREVSCVACFRVRFLKTFLFLVFRVASRPV